MSLTYGFFDALNEDRTYDSLDFGKMFDGVINDGVLAGVSGQMKVTAGTGMNVSVAAGKVWYNRRWAINDSIVTLPIAAAHATLTRIDTVVISVDETARIFKFEVVSGTPSSSPQPPTLIDDSTYHQHALANVWVNGGASVIYNGNIIDKRTFAVVVSELINGYPLYPSVTKWNTEIHAGSVTPSVTLPSVPTGGNATCEIRYIFTAATANASFTAPSGYILSDYNFAGLSPGNTVSYTNLIVGAIYEISFAVLDGLHIAISMATWPTA